MVKGQPRVGVLTACVHKHTINPLVQDAAAHSRVKVETRNTAQVIDHETNTHVCHAAGHRGGPCLTHRQASGCSLSQEPHLACSSCSVGH
jgi:hypothetical protein